MSVKIDAVQARAQTMLKVAQREKDKREQAKKDKKEAAGDEDAGGDAADGEDAVRLTKAVGGLVDRSA